VGWTNENNIPVPPILVANEQQQDPGLEEGQQTNTMHTKIRDQLILAGLLLPGETNPEAENASLQVLIDSWMERGQTITDLQRTVDDLRSKLETAETELGNERQAKADAEAAKTTVEGERDTALANERTARAKADVAVLVTERRLAQAGADAVVEELANSTDYDATLATYKTREPMKTAEASKTTALGSRSPQVKEAEQGLRVELANEISKKENVPFDVAWDRLKNRRKDLFEKVG
jgi:hypothetical protein